MKRLLITTADELTWLKDEPVLFLGEWCKLYGRKHIWSGMDAQVAPYHWDDRKKLQQDYHYLQGLYQELLQEVTAKLNEIHGVNHSLRYWRILIGPWLLFFVEILFDRWEMIRTSMATYSLGGVRIRDEDQSRVTPNDMAHFSHLFSEDHWNEAIYGTLLKEWGGVPITKVPLDAQNVTDKVMNRPFTIRSLIQKLAGVASAVAQKFVRQDEYFFISSYFPLSQEIRMQWHLGQVPKLWRRIPPPTIQIDLDQRHWQLGQSGLVGFPAIVRALIPRHIPRLYLEGYTKLAALCRNVPWPKKPRLIFTSNAFYSDDVFKAWAAEKVENGVPLVIGQHGGNYGIGRWESLEEHQYAISDRWLSWGWSDTKRPNIKPLCNLKLVSSDPGYDPGGPVLLVEMIVPRYSYRMFSVPVAGQWLGYFEDQGRFIDDLPERIRNTLIVRLQQDDYGWQQKQRLQDRYPKICLDNGQASITALIRKSRICIATHNATTFLESMALNTPTIIFWNPRHYELRDSAVPYFELLKKVGIFHDTAESAAQQLIEAWDDVAAWWGSEPVQAVRKNFCDQYSRMPGEPLKDIERELRQISQRAAK